MNGGWGIALILVLVVINGIFVAAEFAIVKVRTTRIVELADGGNRLARIARPMLNQVESYLPVIQLGVTMATLALGWVGEPAISTLLTRLIVWIGIPSKVAVGTITTVVTFGLITIVTIVLGELVPKSLAIRRAEGATLTLAPLLRSFFWLFWPAVWVLNGLTKGVLKILRVQPATAADLAHSEDELRMILSASAEGGHIDEVEQTIMRRALTLGDRTVGQVMVPRTEMAALPASMPLREALGGIAVTNHTRYPVYEDDYDDTIGYVHVKDIYRADLDKPVRSVLRPVSFIAETASVEIALSRFQTARTPLVIVVDEHGGTSGIVTLQDVVEELIGEVQDEFDQDAPLVEPVENGAFSVDGRARLDYLLEHVGLDLPAEGFPTLGGRVFEQLQRRPHAGDEVILGNFSARVLQVDGMRIARVLLAPLIEPETVNNEDSGSSTTATSSES
ncbi:MAG: HlyC/CorC family transporter [Actinobacteria bacterium]|nr:HlyC/CorC family transporter [Actinomycetota bacterium]